MISPLTGRYFESRTEASVLNFGEDDTMVGGLSQMPASQLQRPATDEDVRFGAFVEDVFASLERAEQHRWARAYLNGLVRGNGRRTPRGSARNQTVPPRSSSGLHQFINGSTWEWRPVRRRLALHVAAGTTAYAWTVAELIVPKRGRHSVGVHEHTHPGTGRPVNCQRSLGLFLATSSGCFPVDWNLILKDSWDWDGELRRRARIPDSEVRRPVGAYVLDYADAAAAEPGLPGVPWTLDLTHCDDAAGVLAGLVRRQLDFVCEVDAAQPVVTGRASSPTVVAVGELMERRRTRQRPQAVLRQAAHGGAAPVPVYSALVHLPLLDTFCEGTPRQVRVLEWTESARQSPPRYVVTGFTAERADEVVQLMTAPAAAQEAVTVLKEQFGASGFEGRSFPGWHHHLTMTSAAYAFRTLRPAAAGTTEAPTAGNGRRGRGQDR